MNTNLEQQIFSKNKNPSQFTPAHGYRSPTCDPGAGHQQSAGTDWISARSRLHVEMVVVTQPGEKGIDSQHVVVSQQQL